MYVCDANPVNLDSLVMGFAITVSLVSVEAITAAALEKNRIVLLLYIYSAIPPDLLSFLMGN